MDYIYSPKPHWCEKLWGFIHLITINSHPKKVSHDENVNNDHIKQVLDITIDINKTIINKLKLIKDIIPCNKCLETYTNQLKQLDNINLSEQMALFKWSVDCHNEVNLKLNKPIISYDYALEIWTVNDYYYKEYNKLEII